MRILSVLLLIFLASCVQVTTSTSNSSIPVSPIHTLNLNDESVMYINGIISNDIVELMRKKYKKIKYLVLNSHGGSIDDAYNLSLFVKYNNIVTIIPKNGVCESACTIVFQAGIERYASETSSLMYHGARFDQKNMKAYFAECPKVTEKCLAIFEKMKSYAKKNTTFMFDTLEKYGLTHDVFTLFLKQPIDPNWLVSGNLVGPSDLRFTAKESMKFNAVTRIIEYNIK